MEEKLKLLQNMKKPESFKKIVIALIIFLITYILVAVSFSNQPYYSLILIYFMITILYIMVTISLFIASRYANKHIPRLKLAWKFLTISVLFSAAANIIWAIIDLYYRVNPTTSVADILYLLFFPLFFLGILIFPSRTRTNKQRFKAYFDIFMIIFSLTLVLSTFYLSPALQLYEGDILRLIFSLAYVLGGFILLFALLDLIYNRINSDMQTPLLFLLAGIIILTVTSTVYAYKLLRGTYFPGGVEDLGWIMGYSFLGLAGAAQFTNYQIDKRILNKLLSWHYSYHWTPYLALTGILISYTLLVWAFNTSNPNLPFIEAGCGIIIFMVALRQIISIRENRRLYHAAKKEMKRRQLIQEKLKKSEYLYKTIFENTGTATFIINQEDKIILKNSEFNRISGYDSHELAEMSWKELVTDRSQMKITKACEAMKKEDEPKPRNLEIQYIDKYGILKYGYLIFTLIPGSEDILGSLLDVTQQKKDQNTIKKSLEEKEVLLKEIHHRVKNNLMIISSLLSLQTHYIDNPDQLEVFKESQSRANSMALIHERLYQGSDLKHINFGDYIEKLATEIFHSYSSSDTQIDLKISAEDIMLDIDTSIPLGLILNELLTNAMKHAFPNQNKGEVIVKFYQQDETYVLMVKDNGKGLPSDLDPASVDSLGMQIINNLSRQINGKLDIKSYDGACFRIIFTENAE